MRDENARASLASSLATTFLEGSGQKVRQAPGFGSSASANDLDSARLTTNNLPPTEPTLGDAYQLPSGCCRASCSLLHTLEPHLCSPQETLE